MYFVQGPPFNASIQDTKALRMTFFWGSLFFALLTLDTIPGLAELVSLVSVHSELKPVPCAPQMSACSPS